MPKIIKGTCPECHQTANFTSDYSLLKGSFQVAKSLFGFSKAAIAANVAKDAIGVAIGETAKNYECLSCGEVVHQCPRCDAILKYFNTGCCSECGCRMA